MKKHIVLFATVFSFALILNAFSPLATPAAEAQNQPVVILVVDNFEGESLLTEAAQYVDGESIAFVVDRVTRGGGG